MNANFEQTKTNPPTEVCSAAPQRNSVVFTNANKSAKGGSSNALGKLRDIGNIGNGANMCQHTNNMVLIW